jgi:PAS domain S-box-containing protein
MMKKILLEDAPFAVFSVDLEGKVRTWNSMAELMFGFSAAEVTGTAMPAVPEELRASFSALLKTHLSDETASAKQMRWCTKTGRSVPGETWTSAIRDESGSITAVLFIVADRSERQRAGEQSTQEVEGTRGRAVHDLNNLLLVITGYCELAMSRIPPEDALVRLIQEINAAAERATYLTRHLVGGAKSKPPLAARSSGTSGEHSRSD